MLKYRIGFSGQLLVFQEAVLKHFRKYRQERSSQREAGGQLFARLSESRVLIEEATGPRRSDRRSHLSYVPDRRLEQIEIIERYSCGLHYVGDWHTHPEKFPRPSSVDAQSMAECVKKSQHQLNAFVLVILGQMELPAGLHVSLHDGAKVFTLLAEEHST